MSRKFEYAYEANGFSATGRRVPDVPIVMIKLLRLDKPLMARGPAVVDTGFDGGLYPNIKIVTFLEGLKPRFSEYLDHPYFGKVDCEVYEVQGFLIHSKVESTLGNVFIYTPMEPQYLTDEVLVGREVLNQLKIALDGYKVTVNLDPI